MTAATQIVETQLQLCTFRVAGRTYAVNVLDVREINQELLLTPIPHTDPCVRGLVNIRGQVFLILDLWHPARGKSAVIGPTSRLILFKHTVGHAVGILVDEVGDIISIRQEQLLSGGGESRDGDPVRGELPTLGVLKLENDLVVVLEPTQIISLPKNPPSSTKAAS